MVKRSILSQKVVNCDGASLLECPCAAVDIFYIVNGVRTKQKSFTRRTQPLKFIVVVCIGKVCIEIKTFTVDFLFFYFMHLYLACVVFICYF